MSSRHLFSLSTLVLPLLLMIPTTAHAEPPFEIQSRWLTSENRHAHGLRARLTLAQALIEAGEKEQGLAQLRAVEKAATSFADGFIFNSGNQVDDAKMAEARDDRGYIFGVRRQGHHGKSYTLSGLARYYAGVGEIDKAKALIRQIPSDHIQLNAVQRLLFALWSAGDFEGAEAYRKEVLDELKWGSKQLATIPRLRTDRTYRFVSRSALNMLNAYQKAGRADDAERLMKTLNEWLDIRNASVHNPDVAEYRELAVRLIRYYIDTDRPEQAQRIADACTAKWKAAALPDDQARLRPSLERNRADQIALFALLMKQPAGSAYRFTSINRSPILDSFPERFVEIEMIEQEDPAAARLAYFELGQEINAQPRRCKRYLGPVIDALVRLEDEIAALELVNELQGNLPQAKIKGCPITNFQYFALSYAEGLNGAALRDGLNTQEAKLTSLERLRISGVDTARGFVRAGDMDAARRLIDRSSKAATLKDYTMMRGVVTLRHEAFGEVREDEVRKLVDCAQANIGGNWKRRLAPTRLASVARLLIDIERYDWAEALIDGLSPKSRVGIAS